MKFVKKLSAFSSGPAFAVIAMLTVAWPVAAGNTYNVSTVAQLQAAIATVNAGPGGDRIVMAPGSYAVTSTLRLDADVTLEGDAALPTRIDGSGLGNGLIIAANANNVSLQNFTLENAGTAIDWEGQGIFSATGVTITGFQTGFTGDGSGSTLFTNSTIAGNHVDPSVGEGRGIEAACIELHLTNVTVSGNDVGLYVDFPCGELFQISNSLIVDNLRSDCGGGGGFVPEGDASFDSDGSCVALGFGPGLKTTTPLSLGLGPLAANGGPTLTEAIPATSAARNAGDDGACPATDQRGFLRSDGACDIGAYEYGATAPGGNTQPGTNVSVSPAPGVTVTFSQVTAPGNTTATTGGPPPPTGFSVDGLVYDISTTAVFVGSVTVCLPYNPALDPTPHIYHFEGGMWVDRTSSVDTTNHVVCASASSLSPFAVLLPPNISTQLQQLQLLINSFNLKKPVDKKFTHRLDDARKAWAERERKNGQKHFCEELNEFSKLVQKESGKTLTTDEANQLLTGAALIASEAGC